MKQKKLVLKNIDRKQRIFLGILIFFLSSAVIWWYNTFTIKVTSETICDERINGDVTIVHISDLHGFSFGNKNINLINKIKAQNPDFIAVTGDMYSSGDNKGKETALEFMKDITEIAPVYYVNGEHDHGEEFAAQLEDLGVNVLRYRDAAVTINDTYIHLYGITNVYYTPTFDLANKFELDKNAYNILLAHIENFNKFAAFGMDLSLCGDTHGGQVRLPFIGALYIPDDGVFPDLSQKYTKGLYEKNGKLLYISSGLGNYPVPIRFCNRPEISVIKLTTAIPKIVDTN